MNDTRTVKVVLHPDPAKTDFVQEDAVAEASWENGHLARSALDRLLRYPAERARRPYAINV